MRLLQCGLCGRFIDYRSDRLGDWGYAPWLGEMLFICPRHLAREGQPDSDHLRKWRLVYVTLVARELIRKPL